MIFSGKSRRQSEDPSQEKSLYPVRHVADSLKEYQKALVQKEVASLWELRQVGGSFSAVMEEADRFQDKLRDLDASFANISETTEQFLCVKSDISDSVSEAQNAMEALNLRYGPVTPFDVTNPVKWTWVCGPWPWEGEV